MRTLHNIAIHKYIAFIQSAQYITDWVQLPTKTEMDIYRGKAEEPSFKQLIFTSATWVIPRLEIKKRKVSGQENRNQSRKEMSSRTA